MSKKSLIVSMILGTAMVVTSLTSCTQSNSAKLKVMTGTSLVAAIVQQVGGSHVEVFNLVPPTQHPGNFDVKPGDIKTLSSAKLFLLQGLPGETYVDSLVTAANSQDLKVIKSNVSGNWMIPSIQSSAVDWVLSTLIGIDPVNAADYQASTANYKQAILNKEKDIENKLISANVSRVRVIASSRQADFLQWAGFNVVGTFDDASSLTPQAVKDLVDKGKANGVTLVINNLQDSEDAGKEIAASIGAKNINLSNFPGGFPNTDTWEKAIDYNVNLLLNAMK